ncbi:hypothetical protein ACFPM7_05765 [Actinokineospora guangxiensis]|uniref:Uncharacterized protein n=1 Tax=Actinokineospora guangxiensis TaxID=1490288 RepID=A0ABW0EKU0_9PSEU
MTTPVFTTVRRIVPCVCQPRPAVPRSEPAEASRPHQHAVEATVPVSALVSALVSAEEVAR